MGNITLFNNFSIMQKLWNCFKKKNTKEEGLKKKKYSKKNTLSLDDLVKKEIITYRELVLYNIFRNNNLNSNAIRYKVKIENLISKNHDSEKQYNIINSLIKENVLSSYEDKVITINKYKKELQNQITNTVIKIKNQLDIN